MKTNLFFSRNTTVYALIGLISILMASCGSYQNSSYYDSDGIYGNSARVVQNSSSKQYKEYFSSMQNDNKTLGDTIDLANHTYTETTIINTHPTDSWDMYFGFGFGGYPYYGYGWGYPYYGYGWDYPYYGWGYPCYGWGGGGYYPYYGYGYGYNNYTYNAGRRGSSYSNGTINNGRYSQNNNRYSQNTTNTRDTDYRRNSTNTNSTTRDNTTFMSRDYSQSQSSSTQARNTQTRPNTNNSGTQNYNTPTRSYTPPQVQTATIIQEHHQVALTEAVPMVALAVALLAVAEDLLAEAEEDNHFSFFVK